VQCGDRQFAGRLQVTILRASPVPLIVNRGCTEVAASTTAAYVDEVPSLNGIRATCLTDLSICFGGMRGQLTEHRTSVVATLQAQIRSTRSMLLLSVERIIMTGPMTPLLLHETSISCIHQLKLSRTPIWRPSRLLHESSSTTL